MAAMDIDLLKTFVAICDSKSFTAAARQVGRTQSAVSLQMRRLEESLGRPLFLRGAPGATLTEHGVLLLPNARRILAAVNEALVSFDRATVEGIVVVGMPDDYAPRILVRQGIWGAREFADDLNEMLRDYAASPERSAPNTRIVEARQKDWAVEHLPYLRGRLFATLIDAKLRARGRDLPESKRSGAGAVS